MISCLRDILQAIPTCRAPDGGQPPPLTEEQIREELNRVLASHEFRSSKRSQDFLRYVVENTLRGQGDMVKERTIGIEVFGRPTSYDPSDDATVRVKAGEVRKRLGLYYSDQGAHNPVRIELPSGTYVPEFHALATAGPSQPGPGAQPVPAPLEPAALGRRTVRLTPRRVAGAALMLAAAAVVVWWLARPAVTALDEFWAPVLKGSSPLQLCAAYVPVYGVDIDPSITPPASVGDFTLLTDQFVGGGDLIAISRLSAMLARSRHPYRIKVGNDVSFADLRSGPAVLVGFSYTRWKQISNQMRYFVDGFRRPAGITDNGKATEWVLPNLPRDRRTTEDYAIVSRVFHPDTHAMLVELAGITQYGTDAAADLVTNPDLMAEALRGCPARMAEKEPATRPARESHLRRAEFPEGREEIFLVSAEWGRRQFPRALRLFSKASARRWSGTPADPCRQSCRHRQPSRYGARRHECRRCRPEARSTACGLPQCGAEALTPHHSVRSYLLSNVTRITTQALGSRVTLTGSLSSGIEKT